MIRDIYLIPAEFKSDGCTLPWFLFFLKPIFRPYKEACRFHDWARRHLVHYKILTVQQADSNFHKYMLDLGAWRWFARISWLFVKITRWKYRDTQAVPKQEWLDYVYMRISK